jgi:hypothetical protein
MFSGPLTGEQDHIEPLLLETVDGEVGLWLDGVGNAQDGHQLGVDGDEDGGPTQLLLTQQLTLHPLAHLHTVPSHPLTVP